MQLSEDTKIEIADILWKLTISNEINMTQALDAIVASVETAEI